MFQFTKNLKGIKNDEGDYFFVNQQLPEPLLMAKKECETELKQLKLDNEKIENKENQVKTEIKNKILYVDKVPQKTHIHYPMVGDIFNVSREDTKRMETFKFAESAVIQDKGSYFRGFAIALKSVRDIQLAYCKLRSMYPESDHIMMAFVLRKYSGYQDAGEYSAGKKLLTTLENSKHKDIVVFVAREYGGFHLGQHRFLLIEKVAKEALDALE